MNPKQMTQHFSGISFLGLIALVLTFSSCDNGAKAKRQKDMDDLKAYIQNQKDSIDQYADRKWDDMQASYEAKKAQLEQDTAKMDADMRAQYYQTVSDWEAYKADFERKAEEKKALAGMDAIRSQLAMDGMRSDFTDLTAANILPAYDHFVAVVDSNRDNYTKEQWTVVNVSWKALKGRKREIAKDINADLMGKITKKEIEYVGIKAVNRPFADSEDDKQS
ncbi:MAG: hypothetical protein JST90_19420 [Bacteroidetes bacterium]|nr:hypothetical protein [Bacteroidota bacterium]